MPVRKPSDIIGDPALDSLTDRIPSALYKYSGLTGRRLEWMRSLVVDSRLYFASPSSFNDPLDCRVPPRFDASALDIEQYWRRVASDNFPGQPMRHHKRNILRLIQESKTPDGQQRLTRQLFDTLDRNGSACFSKDPTGMLLWSYYAEGHSGIAVRFNMIPNHLDAIPKRPLLVEVQYCTEFPDFSYYNSTTAQFISTILGTKSTAWAHEQEWRLVLADATGHLTMPSGMIDGVILGIQISPKSEAAVRSWLQQRGSSVELLRVVNKPRSFELQLVRA